MKTAITAAWLVAVGLSPMPVAAQISQDTVLELLSQMEAMQTELRELRNKMELQGHELERLSTRQRELLRDLDRRLTSIERGAATQTTRVQPTEPTQTQTALIQAPATTPSTSRLTATQTHRCRYRQSATNRHFLW